RTTPVPAPANDSSEEIRGKIARIIFHSSDTGYMVLALKRKRGEADCTIQTTTSMKVAPGDSIIAKGTWTTYKGKQQFKADMIQQEIAREAKGIVAWIKNGSIPGVGPRTGRILADHFGERLPDVIDNAEALMEAGIGET